MISEANRYLGQNFSADELLAKQRAKNKPEDVGVDALAKTERGEAVSGVVSKQNVEPTSSIPGEIERVIQEGKGEELRQLQATFEAAGHSKEEAIEMALDELDLDKEELARKEKARMAKQQLADVKAAELADVARRDAITAQLLQMTPEEFQKQRHEMQNQAPPESGVRVKPGMETHEPKDAA